MQYSIVVELGKLTFSTCRQVPFGPHKCRIAQCGAPRAYGVELKVPVDVQALQSHLGEGALGFGSNYTRDLSAYDPSCEVVQVRDHHSPDLRRQIKLVGLCLPTC